MSGRALSLLVYSTSKAGKSTLAVTSPGPRLLLDVEAASRFLRVNKVYWDPTDGSAPPEYDGTWDTCVVAVRDFETAVKSYEWLRSGKHPFRSVILDSITELQVKAQEFVNGRNKMQTQHWGELLNKISFFARDLRDITVHPTNPVEAVVVVATETEKDGVHKPYLQGSVGTQLPFWFDICGYYYVSQSINEEGATVTDRNLLISKHPQYEAGNRVPGLPDVIQNPNISELLDAIFGPVEETGK